jgi:ABC-type lipoprotein release transport system permease subunit
MPYFLSIAFKNIFRDRRRTFTLGINYFFVAFLLFLVFAVTEGTKKNITDNLIASSAGHVTISGEYIVSGRTYQGISGYQRIVRVIKQTVGETRVFVRYALSSAVYHKSLSKRLSFSGIDIKHDRALRDQITLAEGQWQDFMDQPNAVVVPRSIAEYFAIKDGDELLIAARTRRGAFNTATMQVRGIYTTGNYFLREQVITHFDFLRMLDLADSTTASRIFLFFDHPRQAAKNRDLLMSALDTAGFVTVKPKNSNDALNAISAASPRYKVEDTTLNQVRLTLSTADEVTGVVSQAVGAINGLGLLVAAIMLFIISISIFINMRMAIAERMQEIGTLRVIGAGRNDIIALFMFEHVFLSAVFVAAGIIGGLVIVAIFSNAVVLPSSGVFGLFVNKGHLVLKPTFMATIIIVLALPFFTALFSYFPARRGGRVSAVEALNETT